MKYCSAEMADKIVNLLHHNPGAFIRWVAMARGLPLFGFNQTGHTRRKKRNA